MSHDHHKAAVKHILRRVVESGDFRWYMLHTESFSLCLAAYAEDLGITKEEAERQLDVAMSRYDPRQPLVEEQRLQIERASEVIYEMREGGKLDEETWSDIYNALHSEPPPKLVARAIANEKGL